MLIIFCLGGMLPEAMGDAVFVEGATCASIRSMHHLSRR